MGFFNRKKLILIQCSVNKNFNTSKKLKKESGEHIRFLLHLLGSRKKSQNPRNVGSGTRKLDKRAVSQGQVYGDYESQELTPKNPQSAL